MVKVRHLFLYLRGPGGAPLVCLEVHDYAFWELRQATVLTAPEHVKHLIGRTFSTLYHAALEIATELYLAQPSDPSELHLLYEACVVPFLKSKPAVAALLGSERVGQHCPFSPKLAHQFVELLGPHDVHANCWWVPVGLLMPILPLATQDAAGQSHARYADQIVTFQSPARAAGLPAVPESPEHAEHAEASGSPAHHTGAAAPAVAPAPRKGGTTRDPARGAHPPLHADVEASARRWLARATVSSAQKGRAARHKGADHEKDADATHHEARGDDGLGATRAPQATRKPPPRERVLETPPTRPDRPPTLPVRPELDLPADAASRAQRRVENATANRERTDGNPPLNGRGGSRNKAATTGVGVCVFWSTKDEPHEVVAEARVRKGRGALRRVLTLRPLLTDAACCPGAGPTTPTAGFAAHADAGGGAGIATTIEADEDLVTPLHTRVGGGGRGTARTVFGRVWMQHECDARVEGNAMRAALVRAVKIQSEHTPTLTRVELWRQLRFGPAWSSAESAAVDAPPELEAPSRLPPTGAESVRLKLDDLRDF